MLSAVLALIVVAFLGCSAEPGSGPAEIVQPDLASDSETAPRPGKRPHEDMYQEILEHLLGQVNCNHGDWEQDFGDASFYAISFLLMEGLECSKPELLLRGLKTARLAMERIEDWKAEPSSFFENADDLLMGYFGLLDLYRNWDQVDALVSADDPAALVGLEKEVLEDSLRYCVDGLNSLIALFGSYVPDMEGSYSVQTYGNTTVTALFALANVEFATTFGPDNCPELVEQAYSLISVIHEKAWDESLQAYRFRPAVEKLYLYPNITMMLLYGRFHPIADGAGYLERATNLHQSIQPLKDPVQNSYHSPYSMDYMGAMTDDYKTLSSQNYAMLAFMTLYENTSDGAWLDEVDSLLAFIESHLLVDGRVLHHWMDGAVAVPEHHEYYCSGCNFQLLYAIQMYWKYLETR